MAQVHRLFASGAWRFCQRVFGTTPNMAPPSSKMAGRGWDAVAWVLKKPVATSTTDKSA